MAVDWARAKAVFSDLIDVSEHEREARLRQAANGDDDLARAVRRLLNAHQTADDFLQDRPTEKADESSPEVDHPDHIGPYTIKEVLGEGGFGIVYRAMQTAPITREVAIKVLKRGMDTERVVKRFHAERDTLARMAHPGIATVFDAGVTVDGRPFVVMELVHGAPITEHCLNRRTSVSQRVALLSRVARAVHHAHQRAVMHRDLKPSNILVEDVDGEPSPRIIDFGIAKVLSDSRRDGESQVVEIIGTPRYMSPEQVEGAVEADTRVDVYALGMVLCEILTGRLPRDPRTMTARPLAESTAERPSQLVLQTDESAAGDVALSRRLKGDLDRIILKCVEWDPDRRYDSAAALADDLDRFRRGEPVLAAEPSVSYRVRKFVRRHLLATALSAAAICSLLLGLTAAIAGQLRAQSALQTAETARTAADIQAARAEFVSAFLLEDMLLASDPDTAVALDEPVTVESLLGNAESYARTRFHDDRQSMFEILGRVGSAYVMLRRSDLAIRPLREAIAIGEQLDDVEEDVLRLRLILAQATQERGRQDEDARQMRDAITQRATELLGPDHAVTLRARLESLAGAPPQDMLKEVDAMLAAMPGDLVLRRDLHKARADALRALGRPAEEVAARQNVLDMTQQMYRPGHSAWFSARYQLGRAYAADSRFTEAASEFERLFRAPATEIPLNHLGRMSSASMAVRTNLELGNHEEAMALALEAEQLARTHHGAGTLNHVVITQLIAQVMLADGENPTAQELLTMSMAVRDELLQNRTERVGALLVLMTQFLFGLGEDESAIALAEAAMTRQTARDEVYIAAAILKARALQRLGRTDELHAFIASQSSITVEAQTSSGLAERLQAILDAPDDLPPSPH